jgi:myosin heavy subunit
MKKAMSKIAQINKEELSKVELALVDDIGRITNALNSQLSIDDRVMKESVKLYSDLVNTMPKAKERIKTNRSVVKATDGKLQIAERALKQAKKAADDLGVNVSSIDGYNKLEQLISEVQKSQKNVDEISDRLQRLF